MMAAGALDEAARLLRPADLDPGLPVMKAVGVRALHDHLRGAIPLERAIALGRQATRRYAKRQTTWFRTQMPGRAPACRTVIARNRNGNLSPSWSACY